MWQKIIFGKRKFLTIPLLTGLFSWLWPFVIGAGLAFLSFKYIKYSKVKYVAIAMIVLFTIPVGSGWVMGMSTIGSHTDKKEVAGASTTTTPNTPTVTSAPTNTPTPTTAVTPSETPTPLPNAIPTKAPTPTYSYPTPTKYSIPATKVPTQASQVQPVQQTGGGFSCNCSKTCTEISSCSEAQYLLNTCGCSARDGDHDGIACDKAPLHCQN